MILAASILSLQALQSPQKTVTKQQTAGNKNAAAQDSLLRMKYLRLHKKAVTYKTKNGTAQDSFLYYINESIKTFNQVKYKSLTDSDLLFYEKELYYQEQTNFAEALKVVNAFRNQYKKNKHWDKTTLVIANTTAGNYNLNLGNFDTAIENDLLPNLSLIDSLSSDPKNAQHTETYHYGKLLTYNFLILNFTNNGGFKKANRYIDSLRVYVDSRAFSENSKAYIEDVYTTIIDTYLQQGDHAEALFFVRKYEALYDKPTALTTLRVLDKKRKLYYALRKYDSVFKIHEQSKKTYRTLEQPSTNDIFYYGKSLEQTAMVLYQHFSKKEEAIAYLHEAITTTNPAKYTTYINPLFCYSKLTEIFAKQNKQDSVLHYLKKLDSLSVALNNKSYMLSSKGHYAQLYLQQRAFNQLDTNNARFFNLLQWKDTDNFLKTDLKALQLSTGNPFLSQILHVANVNFEAFKESKNSKYLTIAHKLYGICALTLNAQKNAAILNDTDAANFEVINNGILETLQELIKQKGVAYNVSQSLELLELNQNLNLIFNNYLNKISFQSSKVAKPLIQLKNKTEYQFKQTNKTLDEFVVSRESEKDYRLQINKQNALKKTLDSIYQEIQKEDALYYAYEASQVKLEDVQQQITAKQAILRYYFSNESLYVFIIEKDQVRFKHILNREATEFKNLNFYDAITSQNKKELPPLDFLIPSQFLKKNTNRLTIIPHKSLALIPFEALALDAQTLAVNKFIICYAPSLNLLSNNQNTAQLKMAAFVPSYDKSAVKSKYYTNLVAAQNEVKAISQLVDGQVFKGANATKSNFIKATENFNMLHLAMHTQYPAVGEGQSNLVFYENQKESLLSIQEIYSLSTAAKLAVLSACNTGTGNENPSEGIQSLARAFHYAGSDAVVMSLWKVPDGETSKIIVDFYKNLMDGKSKDEALQLAKINYLATTDDPMLKHPYYWAGFVLSGNTQPVTNSFSWVLYLLAGMVSLILMFSFFKYRKRKASI